MSGLRETNVDLFNRFAREVKGCAANSQWIKVETLGDYDTPRSEAFFMFVVAIPPTARFRSGPRKGELKWSKRDKSLDRQFVVAFKELDAFVAKCRAVAP